MSAPANTVWLLHGVTRSNAAVIDAVVAPLRAERLALGPFDAIISGVRAPDGDPTATLSNPDRAAGLALLHHEILCAACEACDVAPVAFGAAARTKEAAGEIALAQSEALVAALATIADSVEFTVALSLAPPVSRPAPPAETATSGRAYLRARAEAKVARRLGQAEIGALRVRTQTTFAERATGVSTDLRAAAGPAEPPRIYEAAFLVRRDAIEGFVDAGRRVYDDAAGLGVALTVTGPMPPYSFVSVDPTVDTTVDTAPAESAA